MMDQPQDPTGALVERVILVDEHDRERGTEEKLLAHLSPRLHRAVSVFVCNAAGDLLIQRRADSKYHSPGLWSNTCCGHPRPGEEPRAAAARRLREEMGLVCNLQPAGVVRYHLDVGMGLHEHEVTHVFIGTTTAAPQPDPTEASDWRWVDQTALRQLRGQVPPTVTAWFALVLSGLVSWSADNQSSLPEPVARAVRAWE